MKKEFTYTLLIVPMICILSMHAAERQTSEKKVENSIVKKFLKTAGTRLLIQYKDGKKK